MKKTHALALCAWTGSILLAICGIPQAVQCIMQGHSDGINELFAWSWFLGEILTVPLVLHLRSYPLLFNYIFNIVASGIVVWYLY